MQKITCSMLTLIGRSFSTFLKPCPYLDRTMPKLFDVEIDNPDGGWANIRRGEFPSEVETREALEGFWASFEPYADANFAESFAREPNSRFWEMYLTIWLLRQGKSVVRRADIVDRARDHGPDIQIIEGGRNVWIECVTPERGAFGNLDRVVDPMEGAEPMEVRTFTTPRREVELRVSSALLAKRNVFQNYIRDGIVGEHDIAIIAISAANFFTESSSLDWSRAATAVYPIGELEVVVNKKTGRIVRNEYGKSHTISRTGADGIPRSAFLNDYFSQVSGIIWSRITIGNFIGRADDMSFVQNHVASNPLAENWTAWSEEVVTRETDGQLTLERGLMGGIS